MIGQTENRQLKSVGKHPFMSIMKGERGTPENDETDYLGKQTISDWSLVDRGRADSAR